MKNRIHSVLTLVKDDKTFIRLISASFLGYVIAFCISQWLLTLETPLPAFLSYILIINTVLALNVILKDKFAAHILLSFNLIIEIISLIYIIKTSTMR